MKKVPLFLLLTFILFFLLSLKTSFANPKDDIEPCIRIVQKLGLITGDGSPIDYDYSQKKLDRISVGIFLLRLKGLYNGAIEYKGNTNFSDSDKVLWEQGRNILSYLKERNLFSGNEKNEFMPYDKISEAEFYKIMLEALGYKQTTANAPGDFEWNKTLEFAQGLGIKPAYVEDFTMEQFSIATVNFLKSKTKTGDIFIDELVRLSIINRDKAIGQGIYKVIDYTIAKVQSARAIGNKVVEVTFVSENIEKDATDYNKYKIEGLNINKIVFIDAKRVHIYTDEQIGGRSYTLKVEGNRSMFYGVDKVAGVPYITSIKGEQVETIDLEFSRTLDFFTASDINNYKISDIEILSANVSDKKVTLKTKGLKSNKSYTVKINNVKSIDGEVMQSESKKITLNIDTVLPDVSYVRPETNQRVVLYFTKPMLRSSIEDIKNYSISGPKGEIAIIKAEFSGSKDDVVNITTTPQEAGVEYLLTVKNLIDKSKNANKMKDVYTKKFNAAAADKRPPSLVREDASIVSKNQIQLAFTDDSGFDEDVILDAQNYKVTNTGDRDDDIYIERVQRVSNSYGKYKVALTVYTLKPKKEYEVEILNVCDEYGNAIKKSNTVVLKMSRDLATPADIKSIKIVNENKIELTFTKALDRSSAESINNYFIDKNVGKPVVATYRSNIVTLDIKLLSPDEKYKIYISDLEDDAGNIIDEKYNFRTDPEAPEIYRTMQLDEKSFEIMMTKEVVDITSDHKVTAGDINFKITIDKDDKCRVLFTANEDITQSKLYSFDISKILADEKGNKAKNKDTTANTTTLYAELGVIVDNEKPYIVNVRAISKILVEVEYNEEIGYAGTYGIEYDEYTLTRTLYIKSYEIKDKNVLINLYDNDDESMREGIDYTLVIKMQAKDQAGNVSQNKTDESFSIKR